MTVVELGCCGAYCRTCKVFAAKACKGCKIGYENGERDITKAKCSIKRCCMEKHFHSCADCSLYSECSIIQAFHNHEGYKYEKYKQAVEYIRVNGYEEFFKLADAWENAYGRYEKSVKATCAR
jgi:hypothetical protein